ncbi:MAG: hypothetical protein ACE365_04000 [Gammaproteobacteria bacterium]
MVPRAGYIIPPRFQEGQNVGSSVHVLLANEKFDEVLDAFENESRVFDFNARDLEGKTLLIIAAKVRAFGVVEKFLDEAQLTVEQINAHDEEHRTALYYACLLGAPFSTIEKLVLKGADWNYVDKNGYSPARLLDLEDEVIRPLIEEVLLSIEILPGRSENAPLNSLKNQYGGVICCDPRMPLYINDAQYNESEDMVMRIFKSLLDKHDEHNVREELRLGNGTSFPCTKHVAEFLAEYMGLFNSYMPLSEHLNRIAQTLSSRSLLDACLALRQEQLFVKIEDPFVIAHYDGYVAPECLNVFAFWRRSGLDEERTHDSEMGCSKNLG